MSTHGKAHRWALRHPLLLFVALAYAFSWSLWGLAALGGGTVVFLIGGLGPAVAAAVVTRLSGGSLRQWLRPVWRWRVPLVWWVYALGLPALLYVFVNLTLQVTGSPVDWSLVSGRLPSYAGTFVFVLFLGGGLEEPGWRGFGLPKLQEKYSPVRATLLLGLVWGVWHVPLYGAAGFIVPMILAFFYTVLWNRTHSIGLCILLHASFTPAQDQLILMARDKAYTTALDRPDWVILVVYLTAAVILVLATRGRLGQRRSALPPAHRSSPNSPSNVLDGGDAHDGPDLRATRTHGVPLTRPDSEESAPTRLAPANRFTDTQPSGTTELTRRSASAETPTATGSPAHSPPTMTRGSSPPPSAAVDRSTTAGRDQPSVGEPAEQRLRAQDTGAHPTRRSS